MHKKKNEKPIDCIIIFDEEKRGVTGRAPIKGLRYVYPSDTKRRSEAGRSMRTKKKDPKHIRKEIKKIEENLNDEILKLPGCERLDIRI